MWRRSRSRRLVAADAAAQVGAIAHGAARAAAAAGEADQRGRLLGDSVQALQAAHAETRRRLDALQEQCAAGSPSSPGAHGSDAQASGANPRHAMREWRRSLW